MVAARGQAQGVAGRTVRQGDVKQRRRKVGHGGHLQALAGRGGGGVPGQDHLSTPQQGTGGGSARQRRYRPGLEPERPCRIGTFQSLWPDAADPQQVLAVRELGLAVPLGLGLGKPAVKAQAGVLPRCRFRSRRLQHLRTVAGGTVLRQPGQVQRQPLNQTRQVGQVWRGQQRQRRAQRHAGLGDDTKSGVDADAVCCAWRCISGAGSNLAMQHLGPAGAILGITLDTGMGAEVSAAHAQVHARRDDLEPRRPWGAGLHQHIDVAALQAEFDFALAAGVDALELFKLDFALRHHQHPRAIGKAQADRRAGPGAQRILATQRCAGDQGQPGAELAAAVARITLDEHHLRLCALPAQPGAGDAQGSARHQPARVGQDVVALQIAPVVWLGDPACGQGDQGVAGGNCQQPVVGRTRRLGTSGIDHPQSARQRQGPHQQLPRLERHRMQTPKSASQTRRPDRMPATPLGRRIVTDTGVRPRHKGSTTRAIPDRGLSQHLPPADAGLRFQAMAPALRAAPILSAPRKPTPCPTRPAPPALARSLDLKKVACRGSTTRSPTAFDQQVVLAPA